MCNYKNNPSPNPTNHNSTTSSAWKKQTLIKPPPPHRKTRTKTRKPKFLSLCLQLSPKTSQMSHHQLNLFPLHPEKNKDLNEEQNDDVAFLFNSDGGNNLNCILGATDSTTTTTTTPTTPATAISSEDDSFSPPSLAFDPYVDDHSASSLVRTAMRNRERDASEERWVCYSEVVEKKELMEEVTSYSATRPSTTMEEDDRKCWCNNGKQRGSRTASFGLLSLKLDYQGILNAWSDKGPLYIHGEEGESPPQTVPDLQFLGLDGKNVVMDGCGCSNGGNLWRVPECWGSAVAVDDVVEDVKMKTEELGGRELGGFNKLGQREASMLRYKEKRQNRLFSKRIRYQVRKINAEKRPRIKGRFVKRN
ncbi:Zinc finger protein like [Quillaja saponaria]|uniref:Zinc finger protein like n=1 Tax=Quillaja saponaria TaxID=32244 RepID=A0AAD7VG79_QUISA|nr:Zinc finger protein like [Quillaja saponaria]